MYPPVPNITNMAELQAAIASGKMAGVLPGFVPSVPQQQPQITDDAIRAIVRSEMAQSIPQLNGTMQAFDAIFQKALSPDDFAAFSAYVQSGAPGFNDLLASDKLYPLAQLMWETIKENQP